MIAGPLPSRSPQESKIHSLTGLTCLIKTSLAARAFEPDPGIPFDDFHVDINGKQQKNQM
jgi:hypothetical protein